MIGESKSGDFPGLAGSLGAGTTLGKYEILEQLGSGGQSIVYKAHDPLLDRHVAIKQVAPQLAADDRFIQRFREVIRELAKLQCEQIVVIHDLIDDERGLFIVMEFVEGHTIETTLATTEEPVEPKAVLQILWRIAAGLSAMHRAGVIHRDVKPGNIIVGEGLRVKITDFGVAAPVGAAASMRLGTTKYMAPELFGGKDVDIRADIYSLGMVAYEMLLGRPKFNEVFYDIVRDPHSEALRWMKWHSSADKEAPPAAEINADVPGALSAIVAKMLAKDPDDRFESLEAVGKEIRSSFSPRTRRPAKKRRKKRRLSVEAAADAEDRGLQPSPIGPIDEAAELAVPPKLTGGPATAEIPTTPMSTRSKLLIAGTVGGILLLGLIGLAVYRGIQTKDEVRQAELAYSKALDIFNQAGKSDLLGDRQTKYQAAMKGFSDIAAEHPRLAVGEQASIMAALCRGYDAVLKLDYDEMGNALQSADEMATRAQRDRSELLSWTREILQERIPHLREFQQNQRLYHKYLAEARSAMEAGDLAKAKGILSETGDMMGRVRVLLGEQARVIFSLRQDIGEKEKQGAYWAEVRRGDDLAKLGKVTDATEAYNEALAILKDAKGTLPEKIYTDLKQTAENKKILLGLTVEYQKALTEAKKLDKKRDYQGAAAQYAKAAQAARALGRDDANDLAERAKQLRHDYHVEQGRKYVSTNELAKAEDEFKQARAILDSSVVRQELAIIQDMVTFKKLFGAGQALQDQNDFEGALAKYNEANKYRPAARKLNLDKSLSTNTRECRFQIKKREGDAHRSAKEWSGALQAYTLAKRIDPGRASMIDAAIQEIGYEQSYDEDLQAAQRARKEKSWTLFMAQIERLRKNPRKSSVDVEGLYRMGRHEEHVDLGNSAMAEGSYRNAMAYYNLAKKYKDTDKIDRLIKVAESALRAEGGT